jgi:hypothetical protein
MIQNKTKSKKKKPKTKQNKQRKPHILLKKWIRKSKSFKKKMRKEKLSLEHRDGDWESNCKGTMLTNNQQYQRKAPIIVVPNMTEKRKNNKVYYNWPVSKTNQGSVKMLFFKNETKHWWPHKFK